MNEKWMAQINGARHSGYELNLAILCRSVSVRGELPERGARVAIGQELSRNRHMRTFSYLRRRIIRADIREQKEHQQRPSTAFHIDTPLHEIRIVVAKTHVHMPTHVRRSLRRGEADGKRSEAFRLEPAALTDQLIVGAVQARRVGGFNERA